MKRIMIDPGHAPGNVNKGNNGYYEYAAMWMVANHLKSALERCGCTAGLTRAEYDDPSLTLRGKKGVGYDLFVSEHSNAANGTARGVEVYHSVGLPDDRAFAAVMSKAVSGLMGNPDRGAKTRESTIEPGGDYYTVMYAARSVGVPHILLIENGFHDNAPDEAFLLKTDNLGLIAETQAKVICEFLDCIYIEPGVAGIPILSAPTAKVEQLRKWAVSKKAAGFFIDLVDIFFDISITAGVNPVVTYCQAAKETAYGRFGGVLDESYRNTCGMKTTGGGGDYDTSAHTRFMCWQDGISAQVDHLALYAGAVGYPRNGTKDPRHFPYLAGVAQTVESLGGRWAPSASYGTDIVQMMRESESIAIQECEASGWAQEVWEWAIANGITDGTSPQAAATREQVIAFIHRALKIFL